MRIYNYVTDFIVKKDTAALRAFSDAIKAAKATKSYKGASPSFELPEDFHRALKFIIDNDNAQLMTILLNELPESTINIATYLNYVGLGEDNTNFRPEVAGAIIDSRHFRKAIADDNFAVISALNKLLTRDDDQSARLADIMTKIKRWKPELPSTLAKKLIMQSVGLADGNCFQFAHVQNFAALADQLTQQDTNEIIEIIGKRGLSESGNSDAMNKKLAIIMDKADAQSLKKAYAGVTANSASGVVAALQQRIEGDAPHAEALIATCAASDASGLHSQQHHVRSLQNLTDMLAAKDDFAPENIFTAMNKAIAAQKDRHLEALLKYARSRCPHVVNIPTPDGSTLLIKALSAKDNAKVLSMGNLLSGAGAHPGSDTHGNDPLTILGSKGLTDTTLYISLKKMLEISFIPQEEKARLLGRVEAVGEAIERLRQLGVDGDTMNTVIAGLLGTSPPQPSRPSMGPRSAQIIDARNKDEGKDLS